MFGKCRKQKLVCQKSPSGPKVKARRTTIWIGAVSRAVFVISRGGVVLYRYVEPTILTHRKPAELVAIVKDLADANLLDPTKKTFREIPLTQGATPAQARSGTRIDKAFIDGIIGAR